MLSAEDLRDWYKRLGLSETSRSAIDHIRSAPPSRRVGGGRQNVSGRYPSRKMGVTIQFESHRVELAGIYEMEHDAGCLEYYDQPPPLKLAYKSANGRHLTVIHTPDFFCPSPSGGRLGRMENGRRSGQVGRTQFASILSRRTRRVALPARGSPSKPFGSLLSRSFLASDRLDLPAEHPVS